MKIAILTSGILPVPAVQGGAVENLIDFYLDYNDKHRLHEITVYSVWHPAVANHPALSSSVNRYHYVDTTSFWARVKRWVYKSFDGRGYYNYFIEYFFEQAYRHLCHEHYDCIVLENRPGYACKLADRGVGGLVLHLHNDLLNEQVPYYGDIYRSLRKVITVSDYIKGQVRSNKLAVQTVYNGIDLQRFSPIDEREREQRREQMGFKADDFIVVFSGRINKDKGISQLIDAMLQLRDHRHVKLLVMGSTFFGDAAGDNDFVRCLKEKARPIEDRLTFTGFVPYDRMPAYLAMADLAVVPSVWDDPLPTTVLEAQAMALPVVATRRGGIPEEVGADNAILLDTGDNLADNLAKAILTLSADASRRQLMGCASRQNAMRFDKSRFAADFFQNLSL